jgi:peptidyl-prolyl cis-trans isomerase SurA
MKTIQCPEWRRAHWALVLLIVASSLLSAHAAHAAQAAVVPLDHIVAVVNDEVITRQELSRRYDETVRNLSRQNTPLPPREVLEKQLLERMITELALQQHARSTGVRVDPAQVERAIQRIAEQNKVDVPTMQAALAKEGQSLDGMRTTIRNEILIARARERDVDNRVTVSDAEIEGYLQTKAQQGAETEYNFSHILIAVPENASPEQIQARRARAEDVLAQLNKGADFAQLSASSSDAPNAMQGGAFGWRASGKMPALFVDALKPLQPGQISPILKSSNGFHILKLNDKRGLDATLNVTQTHARHILIKTNELTSESDARNRLLQLKERIDNGAKFEDLARLHSDDGSASKGGDLGWINPGDTVPEFEKAMNALKVGEISQPVQSPFGLHLIQVLERRNQDVTQERQKLQARQAIRERKAEEAFQDWVRQIRDSAYVELRPID